ncbi:MAG: GTP cyclohydrolase II [Verrucomicrobia bacterium]|nr:GTP cyclohydrolase II [Verrucomicrobiota bacterium]
MSRRPSGADPIEQVIAAMRAGRMVIMTDDAGRENEGDLVLAARRVTPALINFMAKEGRGLICAPVSRARAEKLGLSRMVARNEEKFGTDFTVSVDAAKGITTGISAHDRSATLRALGRPSPRASDLVQPGHIFPVRAKDGGVLGDAAVICEILNPDGSMARWEDLLQFKKRHGLKLGTIQELIEYRRRKEKLVVREQTVKLPTDHGPFDLHLYRNVTDGSHHLALVKGKVKGGKPVLVRVHSECLTGDVFASRRCDCGNQLHDAMRRIAQEKRGVLVYMRQEGRGIGLPAKIQAYRLQERGLDTVEANRKLGYPADLREYGIGAQILADLGVKRMRLLTNNPKKVVGLGGYGLELVDQVPIRSKANPHNRKYLATKKKKLGHRL